MLRLPFPFFSLSGALALALLASLPTHAQFRDAIPSPNTQPSTASANRPATPPPKSVPDDLLAAEDAFKLSARLKDATTAEVRFSIAKGYMLYRENFRFAAEGATLGTPKLPRGTKKFDATFGKTMELLRDEAVVTIPLAIARGKPSATLTITSQGCADAGVCYPPLVQKVELKRPDQTR
jgi:thiol:disulfide interchange protein